MNEVEAVKTTGQLEQIDCLLNNSGRIYHDIWRIGVNVAMRISDLLSLTMQQAGNLVDSDSHQLTVTESKTGKRRVITFNAPAMRVIERRLADYPDDVWLFQSDSPRNSRREAPKPINRRSVARVFERTGRQLVPRVQLGTHSMRKTRGHFMHKSGMPIESISKALGHSNTSATLRYIGLDAESVRRSFVDFEL